MSLHINIEDLLSSKTVESDRIEYKEGWNPDAIYRSICAFANDFNNTGGGYILIGVAENPKTKTAVRPVKGLTTYEIGEIQKDMIGYNNLVKPYYAPRLSIEDVDQQQIIVLWVIAGGERPYEVPETITAKHKTWKYFIRKYASSIETKGTDKEELIALSNNIPFDDRANTQAAITNISMVLVQDHLRKIGSKLVDDIGRLSNVEVLQQMALLTGPIEPDAILLYNSGGPDRSIKREDFVTGKTIPKRYRNRRLGDFLKELKLTEGHATGLPALKKAMQLNGSPEPVFDFDEERTWFQVLMPIHPAFKIRIPFTIDLNKVLWNLEGINELLEQILEYADIDYAGGIAGGIAEFVLDIDSQAFEVISQINKDVAGGIVGGISGGITGGIADKFIKVLEIAKEATSRNDILNKLNMVNNANNFETYIQPLVAINWLTMTIPNKPTSPKQQYLTTLKGRLLLEFLKHKTK